VEDQVDDTRGESCLVEKLCYKGMNPRAEL
jgi:hypothetical protein